MTVLPGILWRRFKGFSFLSAAIAAFIGLLLLLGSLQLWQDFRQLLFGNKEEQQYIQINKTVGLVNTLFGGTGFSLAEIDSLRNLPYVRNVGSFQSNRFKVGASSSLMGFYTELFLESVPNEFLDLQMASFSWREGQQEVPIIISRDYLALYNFGFAPSQGLPQFTPATIQRVQMDITLTGNQRRRSFKGRIVGFSDRVNSILVPEEFLSWANQEFGDGPTRDPSRLILEVDNPESVALQQFLAQRNYELSTGRLIGGQVATLLQLALLVIAIIGVLIVFLSGMVFLLNFQMLIAQASSEIRLLLQLGYNPTTISSLLIHRLQRVLIAVLLAATLTLFLAHQMMSYWLDQQGFDASKMLHPSVWLAALALGVGFFILQRQQVQQKVSELGV
jgi:hypothetical protein